MKTGTDMMAGRVGTFFYPSRRRWTKRNRWLLAGAGLLAAIGLTLLTAMEMGPWGRPTGWPAQWQHLRSHALCGCPTRQKTRFGFGPPCSRPLRGSPFP